MTRSVLDSMLQEWNTNKNVKTPMLKNDEGKLKAKLQKTMDVILSIICR